jgi:predicted GIY-YIG superfamily endonuclease
MTKKAPDHSPATYVITNGERDIYVGVTRNLHERLKSHDAHVGAAFTRENRGPWFVLHAETHDTIEAAEELELRWTSTLNTTGTLPFLDFKPKAWNERHSDRKMRDAEGRASTPTMREVYDTKAKTAEKITADMYEKLGGGPAPTPPPPMAERKQSREQRIRAGYETESGDLAPLIPKTAPIKRNPSIGEAQQELYCAGYRAYTRRNGANRTSYIVEKALSGRIVAELWKIKGNVNGTDIIDAVRDDMKRLAEEREQRAEQDAGDQTKDLEPEQDGERQRHHPRGA